MKALNFNSNKQTATTTSSVKIKIQQLFRSATLLQVIHTDPIFVAHKNKSILPLGEKYADLMTLLLCLQMKIYCYIRQERISLYDDLFVSSKQLA